MRVKHFLTCHSAAIFGCALLVGRAVLAETVPIDLAKLPAPATRLVSFAQVIQPIFAKHCYSCHGPDKQKGELRLDVKEKALAGGDSGPAIVPRRSADSPLIHFVSGLVADKRMPQKGDPLTAEQIGLLRAWIDQGADWPDHLSAVAAPATTFWAFKPIIRPPLPAVTHHASRVTSPIDR